MEGWFQGLAGTLRVLDVTWWRWFYPLLKIIVELSNQSFRIRTIEKEKKKVEFSDRGHFSKYRLQDALFHSSQLQAWVTRMTHINCKESSSEKNIFFSVGVRTSWVRSPFTSKPNFYLLIKMKTATSLLLFTLPIILAQSSSSSINSITSSSTTSSSSSTSSSTNSITTNNSTTLPNNSTSTNSTTSNSTIPVSTGEYSPHLLSTY